MSFLINIENSFDKIQQSFMINLLNKLGMKRYFFCLIKGIKVNITVNFIFNGESLNIFFWDMEKGKVVLSLLFLFSIGLEVLASRIQQVNEINIEQKK